MKSASTFGQLLPFAIALLGMSLSPAFAQRAPVVQTFDLRVPWQPQPVKVRPDSHGRHAMEMRSKTQSAAVFTLVSATRPATRPEP